MSQAIRRHFRKTACHRDEGRQDSRGICQGEISLETGDLVESKKPAAMKRVGLVCCNKESDVRKHDGDSPG